MSDAEPPLPSSAYTDFVDRVRNGVVAEMAEELVPALGDDPANVVAGFVSVENYPTAKDLQKVGNEYW